MRLANHAKQPSRTPALPSKLSSQPADRGPYKRGQALPWSQTTPPTAARPASRDLGSGSGGTKSVKPGSKFGSKISGFFNSLTSGQENNKDRSVGARQAHPTGQRGDFQHRQQPPTSHSRDYHIPYHNAQHGLLRHSTSATHNVMMHHQDTHFHPHQNPKNPIHQHEQHYHYFTPKDTGGEDTTPAPNITVNIWEFNDPLTPTDESNQDDTGSESDDGSTTPSGSTKRLMKNMFKKMNNIPAMWRGASESEGHDSSDDEPSASSSDEEDESSQASTSEDDDEPNLGLSESSDAGEEDDDDDEEEGEEEEDGESEQGGFGDDSDEYLDEDPGMEDEVAGQEDDDDVMYYAGGPGYDGYDGQGNVDHYLGEYEVGDEDEGNDDEENSDEGGDSDEEGSDENDGDGGDDSNEEDGDEDGGDDDEGDDDHNDSIYVSDEVQDHGDDCDEGVEPDDMEDQLDDYEVSNEVASCSEDEQDGGYEPEYSYGDVGQGDRNEYWEEQGADSGVGEDGMYMYDNGHDYDDNLEEEGYGNW